MDTRAMELFFSLLALAADVAIVGLILVLVASRRSPAVAALRDQLGSVALPLAWLVALTSTLGSLYFSEIANFTPCTLCWYQRIAMYPLAIVLAIAAARRDVAQRIYVWPVALVGAVVSSYHVLIERYPSLESGGICSLSVPCTQVWFRQWGFITIAYMALTGFVLIALLLALPRSEPQEIR